MRKNTIVFCNGAVPVQQWYDQFQLWTTVNPKDVIMLTSKHKQELPETPCILITTYTMVSHSGHRSEETERIMEQIAKREWGLMVIDEVQEMRKSYDQRRRFLMNEFRRMRVIYLLMENRENLSRSNRI